MLMSMIEIKWDGKESMWVENKEDIERLKKNFFGEEKNGRLYLKPEETLYIMNFMNGVCFYNDKKVEFNEMASVFSLKEPRLFIKFNAYRDWRDRGLIIKRIYEVGEWKKRKKVNLKKYPSRPLEKTSIKTEAVWYPDSLFSVIEDENIGQELFINYWFGQYGVYRQERGNLLKLNFLETVFLSKHFGLKVKNTKGKQMSYGEILNEVMKKREYAKRLYEVYEDWRLRGFVVKTGFKFGSHFRIYFPGASPALSPKKKSKKEWIHSKHVLHVFPKEQKLLVSEWARAVRVAHSVKKTFLLSVPELEEKDYIDYPVDFVSYRRKKQKGNWVRETPDIDKPRYLLVAFSEDDHIGGVELASLLKKAEGMGLQLLLSITDRETAITYYVLNKIMLPQSDKEYYEIEWMKP